MNSTERHEKGSSQKSFQSSQKEPDANLVVHAHEIFKESSSKVFPHISSDDTDVLLVTLAHMYKFGKTIYIIDSHE